MAFDNCGVPSAVQGPRIPFVRRRLSEVNHLDLVSTSIVVVASMKRLMYVADEVDDILQSFQPCLARLALVRQDPCELPDLRDDAVAIGAISYGVVTTRIERNIDIVPWPGFRLIKPMFISP